MNYLIARLSERSTWQGLVAMATAFGVSLDPSQSAAVIAGGVALAGLVHAFFPQNGKLGSK